MTDKKKHQVGRIDQIVRDYFNDHPNLESILAKDLMPLFIDKGIFIKDHRNGLPIRQLLRELDDEQKLSMLVHCKPVRKAVNTGWHFERHSVI